MSHDDGPAPYTPNLLQYLDQNSLKTTFFAVGSRCLSYPALLQEEYMAQHQIAVHTWSHPQMTTLSNDEIIAELGWSKKVIKDVLGVTPTYWRPPFGDVDNRVRAIAKAMNLATVIWTRLDAGHTFDTNGKSCPSREITKPACFIYFWALLCDLPIPRSNSPFSVVTFMLISFPFRQISTSPAAPLPLQKSSSTGRTS